jgi:hypothetical protein
VRICAGAISNDRPYRDRLSSTYKLNIVALLPSRELHARWWIREGLPTSRELSDVEVLICNISAKPDLQPVGIRLRLRPITTFCQHGHYPSEQP